MSRRRYGRWAAALLVGAAAFAFWRALPERLFDAPTSAVLLDRSGVLLGARIAADGQWRFPPIERVPERYRVALLNYEDRRFEHHPGVDPLALGRALYVNLRKGHVVSGGSTITMQVIRMARGNPPRTYGEKLKEALLALRLELRYSKEEILALYASHAPFGGNVVGLEAAAWRYFGRSPASLSWAEACTLAVLPNSPGLIHPGRHRDALRRKRDHLLLRLQQAGVLTPLDYQLATAEPLPQEPLPLPHVAYHLLASLQAQPGPQRARLATTLDGALQRRVEELVARHSQELAARGMVNAAAVVVDNRSFEVLAYVGNSGRSLDPDLDQAVDVVQRPRSTGSVLKPFLFAAMIQDGDLLPDTLVPDLPTQYGGYIPENFDRRFRGAVPAKVALARSLNVPAVRMLRQYGVSRFYDLLHHLGMGSLFRLPDEYGLTLILGGAEGTLWDLTGMYANLARLAGAADESGGLRYRTLRVLGSDQPGVGPAAEIGPAAAWLTLEALLEVNRPGTEGYWRNFSSSRQVAWKTGTSYGERDGWAIGVTPRYTVGVWVGNASGEGRPGLTGLATAAPILFDIYSALPPTQWFPPPQRALREVTLCADDGFLANGHCRTEQRWAPAGGHFDRLTPYHRVVHLDASGTWRVHAGCERVSRMVHRDWFVLPAGQEFYYRQHNSAYRTLPPFRPDCVAGADGDEHPIDLLYPTPGTRIYIPTDLGAQRQRVVFEAVHRDPAATLYWHLDDQYVGTTRTFHQQALDVAPGLHHITVVDGAGNRLSRQFEVIGAGASQAAAR